LSPCERDEIRALGARVPMILLTGRAWGGVADAADLNVICILAKPVVLDDIIEQIRRCLSLASEPKLSGYRSTIERTL
jgi:hypothetical protein